MNLIYFLSFLSPDEVPKELLMKLVEIENEEEFNKILELLVDFSMVRVDEKGVTIHRLVQKVIIDSLSNVQLPSPNQAGN